MSFYIKIEGSAMGDIFDMEVKIGVYLYYYRMQLGMSQEHFSQHIGIGVKQYHRIENGIISTTIGTLEKIVSAIGISFSNFFSLVEVYNMNLTA